MLPRGAAAPQDQGVPFSTGSLQGGPHHGTNMSGQQFKSSAQSQYGADFGQFSVPSVRTSYASNDNSLSQHGRPRSLAPGAQHIALPITPHADLDAMCFIIPDGPLEQLQNMRGMNFDSVHQFVKPEPLSPGIAMQAGQWGMYSDPSLLRTTPEQAQAMRSFVHKARELQIRQRNLWEMENHELQRGAELRIIHPGAQPSVLDASPGRPPSTSTMAHLNHMRDMSNTLNSPNSQAFWRTLQGLASPTCFADVRLLETPTKSALVDLC